MKFRYKVITKEGKTIEGEAEARDKFDLARKLKSEGKSIVYAEEIIAKEHLFIQSLMDFVERVSLHDKIIFTQNLSVMINAGLPLVRALGVLIKQTRSKKFKNVLKGVLDDVNKGDSLSEALGKYPRVFPKLSVSMVKAGEESGTLPDTLKVVGEHLERSYLLQKRIRGALMYPAVIVSAMAIIGVLMMIYVVPTLTGVFGELEVDIPFSTKVIIFISDFLGNHIFISLFLVIFVAGTLYLIGKSKLGRKLFEKLFLRLPLIGELVRETNSARTSRTLSSLLSSGVNMLEALAITRDVVQNSHYKRILKEASERVQKGTSLASVFAEYTRLYPPLFTEMIAVGEETGKLSDMLLRIAVFYESEIEQKTKNMSTIIEPVLMIIVGLAVGFFAISMITPLYSVLEGV